MTIYQKELLRQLSNLGCAGYEDEQSGMLNITMDGLPLCIAGKKGDLYWDKENVALPERRKAVDALCKAADLVREYVSLYEASPQMKPESVPEYRQLAEYGSIVLGAMYSETHGLLFKYAYVIISKNLVGSSPHQNFAVASFLLPLDRKSGYAFRRDLIFVLFEDGNRTRSNNKQSGGLFVRRGNERK